jgi:hypothetical protein
VSPQAVLQVEGLEPYLERIQDLAVDWADPDTGRLDWEDFLGRLERYLDLDLPTQMDDPVIRRIQKISRAAVREATD